MNVHDAMSYSQKAIGPFLKARGYKRDHRAYARPCGDVLHYFGWGLPRPWEGGYLLHPELQVVSPPLLEKVGIILPRVGYGAGSLSILLGRGRLLNGWHVRNVGDVEAAVCSIMEAYAVTGEPILAACCSTEELIALRIQRPELSIGTKERAVWESKVWRNEIDPDKEPFVRTPTAVDRVPKGTTNVEDFVRALHAAEAEMEAERRAAEQE